MIRQKIGKVLKKLFVLALVLGITGTCCVFGVNSYVVHSTKDRILSPEDASNLSDVDCILVLGCYVHENGRPSDMLADRLRRGLELHQSGASPKLLMSGDHGQTTYDEVNAMKLYAINRGVSSSDVFMDHAGFSTYESLYRARDVFKAKKIIIVTQEYHLHRALYVARALGLEAYGVSSDYHNYIGQFSRDVREILARNKDFVTSIFKPKPTFLGEAIPVSGNGDLTNDKVFA